MMSAPISTHCPNCGQEARDRHCSRCGQRMHRSRLTTRALLRALAGAINLDSGLLYTVRELSLRPGGMVKEYIAGRTRPFTNPANYLLLCAAVATFASVYSGWAEGVMEQLGDTGEEAPQEVADLTAFMNRYFNVLLMLAVPLLPLFSLLLFRRAGYNYAEHLVFSAYVYAQQNLLIIATLPVFFLAGDAVAPVIVYFVLMIAYYVWAAHGFFGFSAAATVARGITVMILFSVVSMIGQALVVAMAVRFVAAARGG